MNDPSNLKTECNDTRSVNGGATTLVDQPDSGGGDVVISVPVLLNLNAGSNTITFGGNQSSEFYVLYHSSLVYLLH